MGAERVGGVGAGAGGSERGPSGGEEMNGNSSKVVVGGGGGGRAYRWNGDAVPLKRRRVGLSNGASLSDGGGSSDDEDEGEERDEEEELDREEDDIVGEDTEQVAPDEYSDDYEETRAVGGGEALEEEEDEEDEEEQQDEEEEQPDEEEEHPDEEEEQQEEDDEEVEAEEEIEAEEEAEEEAEDEVEEEAEEEPEEPEEPEAPNEEAEEEEHLIPVSSMDHLHRGGGSSSRARELPISFDEHDDIGTEDEGYDEEEEPIMVPDSPPVVRAPRAREREREREIEISSPEDVGGREASDDSVEERRRPPLRVDHRGFVEPRHPPVTEVRHHHRETVVPEKPARGMMDTAKRKAAQEFVAPRNGSAVAAPPKQPQPKKEKAPAAPKRKANGEGPAAPPKERTRFSADNKARVTLERAREILAAVKAQMLKDPKHFTVRHSETHAAVENSSSSEDERRRMLMQHHHPPAAAGHRTALHAQVKVEEKAVKKRSRAAPAKGEKEATPRRRKPKVEIDYHRGGTDEKPVYRRPQQQVDGSGYDHHSKLGHFSGAEAARMEVDDHRSNGYSRDDGYELQQAAVVEKKVRKRRKPKEGEDGASATGLCPGSVIRDENWIPPASPYSLIQEKLYKDPWKVLLSCMLLNKTAGRQMHKVIWDLFSLCPDAETAINMDTAKIAEKVYSLGLQNKRAKMIQRFSLEYLRGDWTNVTQLHGIGKYAADAYAIFCQGLWREVEPDDVQLNKYWKWLWDTNGTGASFATETS